MLTNSFICETDPKKNLETFANFDLEDISSTRCMTEKAYRLLPKSNISNSTLREISLVGAGFTLLIGPFYHLATKVYECGAMLFSDGNLTGANECKTKLLAASVDPVTAMAYLCFASAVSLTGIGTYAALRLVCQDKTQGERFALLDKQYLAAANSLLEQYRAARGKEKQGVVQTARQVADRSDLIHASLKQVARLTESQASALTVKISHAAKSILQNEERPRKLADEVVFR